MEFDQVKPGYVKSSKKTIKIHISELKIGMYVSKLDRDWLETPFLMQGFLVESPDDIAVIAEYSEYVWVDAVREEWTPPDLRGKLTKQGGKQRYINKE